MPENDNEREHQAILLDELSREERAETFEDIAQYMCYEINTEKLCRLMTRDKRFISLGDRKKTEGLQFVPRRALFHALLELNKRANLVGLKRISIKCFFAAISRIFVLPLSRKDKEIVLAWARDFLLTTSISSEKVSFSVPDLVCWINGGLKEGLWSVLEDISSCSLQPEEFEHCVKTYLENFFGGLSLNIDRHYLDMVLLRLGLTDGRLHTLEDVGFEHGLTRERVRQVEKKFKQIVKARLNKDDKLLRALFVLLLKHRGRRIYSNGDGKDFFRIRFISETYNLPFIEFSKTNAYILGVDYKKAGKIIRALRKLMHFDPACTSKLQDVKGLFLCPDDWDWLNSTCASKARNSLKWADVIYFVMKKIGKPASYQQIAEQCKHMFPELEVTPTKVLAVLSRDPKGQPQDSPWVWTGTRGVYALREWGFERPTKSLPDTVYEIVKEKFEKTGKPVSLAAIYAEIGKYRKIVNKNSINITAYTNPKLTRVGSYGYIPVSSEDEKGQDMENGKEGLKKLDELDRALRSLDDS